MLDFSIYLLTMKYVNFIETLTFKIVSYVINFHIGLTNTKIYNLITHKDIIKVSLLISSALTLEPTLPLNDL